MEDSTKRMMEESMKYTTVGTSAVEPKVAPKYEPQTQKQQRKKQKQEVKPQIFPDVPKAIKVQVLAAICVVTVIVVALMAYQARVAAVTAENNQIANNIEELNKDIRILQNDVDRKVAIDDVMNVINEEGLIKPSENNIMNVNP